MSTSFNFTLSFFPLINLLHPLLSRPRELWAVKQIVLSENELSGRLPDCWATTPALEVLDLRHNQFKVTK